MTVRARRAYGTWPSPVTPELLVAGGANPGEVRVDGDDIWWSEARPAEGGRVELVRRRLDGTTSDVLGRLDATREPTDGEALDPERRWSARTALLEYGGGAWCVESGVVVFAQADDQRLHRLVADDPDAVPQPLTPRPRTPRGLRYGDLAAWDRNWVLAVRESHPGEGSGPDGAPEAVHEIVAVPTDGSAAEDPDRVRVLVTGPDFVSNPRPGPARLAWVRWDHPNMPWDGTELCVARLGRDAGGGPELRGPVTVVAGGPEESVVQPEWDRGGDLWFCSDRSGWWNLHRVADPGGEGTDALVEAVAPVEAELGGPRWVAGLRWYAPLPDGRVLAAATAEGTTDLVLVEPAPRGGRGTRRGTPGPTSSRAWPGPGAGGSGRWVPLAVDLGGAPLTVVGQVGAGPGSSQAVVVAASALVGATPLLLDLPPAPGAPGGDAGGRGAEPGPGPAPSDGAGPDRRSPPGDGRVIGSASGGVVGGGVVPTAAARPGVVVLRPAHGVGLGPGGTSVPEPIEFPSAGGRIAHALLYRPASTTWEGSEGERPPLVVTIHGGPTSAARPMFDLRTQFWTSRGFALVDVDYGGSTGYGRPYRRLLDGQWGVVDVEDCLAAAHHLAAEGVVDGRRMVIRGGSAGGLTALLALCAGAAPAGEATRPAPRASSEGQPGSSAPIPSDRPAPRGTFAAGTTLYGVTDLAALARDTHKFEARYTDGLVGPWPEAADLYAARSPLGQLDRLATPVLVLQGADDHVVPPDQAERVVAALRDKGIAHEFVLFEGEGHGFRRAETIVRALEAELAFYARILDLPAHDLPAHDLPDSVG